MEIGKHEVLYRAASVLMDTAIEYQDGSDNTALVNLLAADLRDFFDKTPDMRDPKDAQDLARLIVQDGERLARSEDFDEQSLGALVTFLYKGLADGTEIMERPTITTA